MSWDVSQFNTCFKSLYMYLIEMSTLSGLILTQCQQLWTSSTNVVIVNNPSPSASFAFIWYFFLWFFSFAEELNENLRNFNYEYIFKSTGCAKPCKYRKYKIVEQQPTVLDSVHFTFSLWVSFYIYRFMTKI